jgi:hypothetical protein
MIGAVALAHVITLIGYGTPGNDASIGVSVFRGLLFGPVTRIMVHSLACTGNDHARSPPPLRRIRER